jgi:COMPASS component SWD1
VTENWSAYAPGFDELDENVEYREREDEFDYVSQNHVAGH